MKTLTNWVLYKSIHQLLSIALVISWIPFQGLNASPDEWSSFVTTDSAEEAWMVSAMSCKPSVQVSLDQQGMAQIMPSMLVTGPEFGWDQYEVDIMGPLNDIVSCDQIGQELMAVVEELPTGNTCMSTLVVLDKLSPLLICTGDFIPCNTDIDTLQFINFVNVLEDNCDEELDLFYTFSVTAVDCNPQNIVSYIKVNWTATDDYNNFSTCSDTIFLVKPNIDEVVFPNDTVVSCTDPDISPETIGGPTVFGGPLDHTCKFVDWYEDYEIPMCSGMTKVIRTWFVMDWCTMETEMDMQEILIEDNVPPVVECPQDLEISTLPLDCYALYALPGPVSVSDACSDPDSIEVRIKVEGMLGIFEPGEVVQLELGDHEITIEAIDDCLNKGICTYTVTVVDDVLPTAVCSHLNVGVGANGISTVLADTLDFHPFDNCGVDKVEVSRMEIVCNDPTNNVFDESITVCCADVGDTIMVAYKVTDVNGNMNTCMFTIGVKDALPPMAECKDITLAINDVIPVSVSAEDIDDGSTDNCEIASLEVAPNSFDCSNLGDQGVILTVTDASGNVATCAATVTLIDTLPPAAVCSNLTRELNSIGQVSIATFEVDGGSYDNCGLDTLFITQYDFECKDIGENMVDLIAIDDSGNSDTCTAIVTIVEIPPIANCKDVTVELDADGMASITANDVNDNSYDECGIQSLEVDPEDFTCAEFGDNTVVLTVTDFSNLSDTCSAQVKVKDLLPPTCVTKDITVFLDESGTVDIMSSDIDDGSADNCSDIILMAEPMSFDCEDLGDNLVELTVTDIMDNMTTCSATVTVKDTIAPDCNAASTIVYLDGNGEAVITPGDINNGSLDNCDIPEISVDPSRFDCSQAGQDVEVTLTLTDVAGNTTICTADVSVLDTISPDAVCRVDIEVFLDQDGLASITVDSIDSGSGDNCPGFGLEIDQDAFVCSDTGSNLVTLLVTDASGNTDACTTTVEVLDTIPPVAVCTDITVMLDGSGMASTTPQAVDGGTSDNCGFELSATPLTFDCDQAGMVVPVTLTATDPSGNTDDCIAQVNVMENQLPQAVCQNTTVWLDMNGDVLITPDDVDGGSGDNCGSIDRSVDPSTFDCDDIDTNPNEVILRVTDDAGNSSTCVALVTVLDTISPTAICADDFDLPLDGLGNATISVSDIDNNSDDNCAPVNTSIDMTAFDCGDTGDNVVTLTVVDPSGNSATCTTTVTIVDNMNPVAVCSDITVTIGANAMVTITPDDVDGGSEDNCPFDLSASPLTFDCGDLGLNVVELVVTDASGNTGTCEATVTVVEELNLQAICQDITVELGMNGTVTITPEQVDGGSQSTCQAPDLSIDVDLFDCSDTGTNQVILTATSGINSDECIAVVTVVDNTAPTAECQSQTIYLDGAGNASITAAEVDNGSFDNCPFTTAIDLNSFTCADTGPNNVTLTVTDQSGNTATCISVVTVLDTISPVCATQDITISLDGNGNAMITVNDINNGSSDNCAPLTFGLTPTNFTCDDLGDNIVTLTVQDPSANTKACQATVTVIDEGSLVANCQNITVSLDQNGQVVITPGQIDTGSGGGCTGSNVNLALDETDFNCDDIGPNIVTLTVTDQMGNSASCTATVTVVDDLSPVITCPPNVQLNCNDEIDLGDLSEFGVATAVDNCVEPVVTESSNIDLDNCGAGTILRTFTATDNTNPPVQCVQTIAIGNPDPFDAGDIDFPPALIELTDCASTDPEDIPNGSPVINLSPTSCAAISVNFEDSDPEFTVDNDPNTVCQSFTRTWTIIDTCQLEPGTQNGIFVFVQTITVNDFTPPVFNNLNDINLVATPGNCEIFVNLVASATDCSEITYTNDSPYGNTDGADASGNYPFGTTVVTFTATDECGNISSQEVEVEITEQSPPMFQCIKIVVELPPELEITIHARDYVVFTPGTCSDINDYYFSYSNSDPFDSLRTFSCGDVGVTTRSLWFYDLDGMKIDSCNTADLELDDNDDSCGDGFTIGGEIESEDGFAVEETEVMIQGMPMEPAMTSETGNYFIQGLFNSGGYTVKPSRDKDDLEGISTLDLVGIQKHLLGIAPLTSPYKMIAADVNRSGRVSGLDVLELRKLLLGIYSEFPENESWRFVESTFQFPDPYNPFMTEFPESVYLDTLMHASTEIDFIGIKVGDVNGSYFNLNGPEVVTRTAGAALQAEDLVSAGGTIEVPFYLAGVSPMIGIQFSMEFDPALAAGWEIEGLNDIFRPEDIHIADNRLTVVWNDVENIVWDEETPVFTIRLHDVHKGVRLSDMMLLAGHTLKPEVYQDGEQMTINALGIEWIRKSGKDYALYQNIPNPFTDETMIGFSLPNAADVEINVYQSNGQLIWHREGAFSAGIHQVSLGRDVFTSAGVYYYSILTDGFTATRKMILQE